MTYHINHTGILLVTLNHQPFRLAQALEKETLAKDADGSEIPTAHI